MSDLLDYVTLVAKRVEDAGERGDRAEAIRLLRLLRDEAERQAAKLDTRRSADFQPEEKP
jgi:hypothetical protein